jgi:hypothetical protein
MVKDWRDGRAVYCTGLESHKSAWERATYAGTDPQDSEQKRIVLNVYLSICCQPSAAASPTKEITAGKGEEVRHSFC